MAGRNYFRPLKSQIDSRWWVRTVPLILIVGWGGATVPLQSRWVLVRTTDGTTLAENTTYSTTPSLRADLSQFFGDEPCDALGLRARGGSIVMSGLGRVACSSYGNENMYVARQLWHTQHYGCPEREKGGTSVGTSRIFIVTDEVVRLLHTGNKETRTLSLPG